MKYVIYLILLSVFINAPLPVISKQQNPSAHTDSLIKSYRELGYKAQKENDYFASLEQYYKALDLCRKKKDFAARAAINKEIGNVYNKAGFEDMALYFYNIGFELYKELDDSLSIAHSYYNIARAYLQAKNTTKAQKFFELSIDLYKRLGQVKYEYETYNSLGILFRLDSNYSESYRNFQKSLEKENRNYRLGMLFNNIGYNYQTEGNIQKAHHFYQKAFAYENDMRSHHKILLYQNYASIVQSVDTAMHFHKKALALEGSWVTKEYLQGANALFQYYFKAGNDSLILQYQQMGHQAGLKLVKQRDEMKQWFDLYQVKAAHYKRQSELEARTLQTRNKIELIVAGIFLSILIGAMVYTLRKQKRIYRTAARLTRNVRDKLWLLFFWELKLLFYKIHQTFARCL